MGPGHRGAIGKETDEPEAQEMPSERKQNPDLVLSKGVGNGRHSYPGSLLGLAVGTLRVLKVGTMGILEVSCGWLAHIVEGSMVLWREVEVAERDGESMKLGWQEAFMVPARGDRSEG